MFSVRDTGRGIGREEKERIFGEFVRLSSAQGVDGFGLGLSIVDRLVKLLGGTISLESRLGEGSRFIVSVPVGEAGPAVVQEVREPAPPQPGLRVHRGRRRPVATGDDRRDVPPGGRTECCQYPEYVARLVADERFDLVLTDIQMPSADGFSVLKAVHGVDPALCVVAVSAAGSWTLRILRPADLQGASANRLLTANWSQWCVRPAAGRLRKGMNRRFRASGTNFDPLTVYAGDDAGAARNILASFAEQTAANVRELEKAVGSGERQR